MIESVQATTACFGLRPVANALGTGLCMIAIFGIGRSASLQSFSIVRWSSGYSSSSMIREPVLQSTSLSEKKNWTRPMTTASPTIRKILTEGKSSTSTVMNTR